MKRFQDYVVEADRGITFVWGRMNPPTIGHQKVMDVAAKTAAGGKYIIYITQTQDSKKNPLTYEQKVKYARKMFPRHARNILLDKNIKTVFDALVKFYDEGYGKVTLVAGSDRIAEYKALISKYNGVKARHGFYNFQGGVNVVSAGERDPDAEGAAGMSATKMRNAAKEGDFKTFQQGLPPKFMDGQQMLNDVRAGLGLAAIKDFREHVELEPVSETREAYVAGELFGVGDLVVVKESDQVGEVQVLGANYVIIETADGNRLRKWLDDVESLEEVTTAVDRVKDRHKKDKERLAKRHDRQMDNAKLRDVRKANAATQPSMGKYESFSSFLRDQ